MLDVVLNPDKYNVKKNIHQLDEGEKQRVGRLYEHFEFGSNKQSKIQIQKEMARNRSSEQKGQSQFKSEDILDQTKQNSP